MIRNRMLRAAAGSYNAGASIAYNGYYFVTGNTTDTSTTWTGVNFGSATSNRIIAVYIAGASTGTLTVSSVTIGGVSATLATNTVATARHNALFYAVVSSGTSGSVTATYSTTIGDTSQRFLSCVSIYNTTSSTPIVATDSTASTGVSPSLSVVITPAANSVLFAGYAAGSVDAGTTSTWTNANEQTDTPNDGSAIFTDAIISNLPNVSRTITATGTDVLVNLPGLVVATWA